MLKHNNEWRLQNERCSQIAPSLPPRKPHPLGSHWPRVNDRKAMDAMWFVLRTGCQWNALKATASWLH